MKLNKRAVRRKMRVRIIPSRVLHRIAKVKELKQKLKLLDEKKEE